MNLFYVKKNVTRSRPSKQDLSVHTLEVIEEFNQLDLALYQFVREQFRERLKSSGLKFRLELKLFRVLNTLYGFAYKPTRYVYHRLSRTVKL